MNRIAVLVLAVAMAGCSSATYKVHPGAGGYVSGPATPAQAFASSAYDSLVGADAVIQQTRASFLANKFPVSAMPTIKTAFNATVKAYDDAQAAWIAFNTSAANGGTPSQDAVNAALAALTGALTQLTAAKGGS